jgi:hypothetical protein
MNTLEIKDKIVEKLDTIEDTKILESVLNYLEKLKKTDYIVNKEIIAYSITGEPISKQDYIIRNKQAVDSYKKGNFKTQKELLEKYKKSI